MTKIQSAHRKETSHAAERRLKDERMWNVHRSPPSVKTASEPKISKRFSGMLTE